MDSASQSISRATGPKRQAVPSSVLISARCLATSPLGSKVGSKAGLKAGRDGHTRTTTTRRSTSPHGRHSDNLRCAGRHPDFRTLALPTAPAPHQGHSSHGRRLLAPPHALGLQDEQDNLLALEETTFIDAAPRALCKSTTTTPSKITKSIWFSAFSALKGHFKAP